MFANFLIGLREGLEAALVVGILVAYLVKTGRAHLLWRIWLGVGVATAVSLAVGAALTFGPRGLTFEALRGAGGDRRFAVDRRRGDGDVDGLLDGEESRGLRSELEGQLEEAVGGGVWSLPLVALLAVGREGLETALFLWAAAEATDDSATPLAGGLLGIVVAVVLGVLVYRGAVRLDVGRFFRWTAAFLIVVAAGVLAYGVHDLQEAEIVPGLHSLAFDVSDQVPPESWYGTVLKGTVNFSPRTTWLEAAVWVAYLVPTMFLYWRVVRGSSSTPRAAATPLPT